MMMHMRRIGASDENIDVQQMHQIPSSSRI
jgi:hypothetical protein